MHLYVRTYTYTYQKNIEDIDFLCVEGHQHVHGISGEEFAAKENDQAVYVCMYMCMCMVYV
jgi:hypothetical protein